MILIGFNKEMKHLYYLFLRALYRFEGHKIVFKEGDTYILVGDRSYKISNSDVSFVSTDSEPGGTYYHQYHGPSKYSVHNDKIDSEDCHYTIRLSRSNNKEMYFENNDYYQFYSEIDEKLSFKYEDSLREIEEYIEEPYKMELLDFKRDFVNYNHNQLDFVFNIDEFAMLRLKKRKNRENNEMEMNYQVLDLKEESRFNPDMPVSQLTRKATDIVAENIRLMGFYQELNSEEIYAITNKRYLFTGKKKCIFMCEKVIEEFSLVIETNLEYAERVLDVASKLFGEKALAFYRNKDLLRKIVFSHELGHLVFDELNKNSSVNKIDMFNKDYSERLKDTRMRKESQANHYSAFSLGEEDYINSLIWIKTRFQSEEYKKPVFDYWTHENMFYIINDSKYRDVSPVIYNTHKNEMGWMFYE